jgi:hypothetical protein
MKLPTPSAGDSNEALLMAMGSAQQAAPVAIANKLTRLSKSHILKRHPDPMKASSYTE